MHPPYVSGTGCVFALTEPVGLPEAKRAEVRDRQGRRQRPRRRNPLQVAVVAADGTETLAAERVWDQHAWSNGPWTWGVGQGKVQLKTIADVGKDDNSSGDWTRWANLRMETAAPVPVRTLHGRPVILTHANHAETPAQVDLAHPQGNRRAGLPGGHRPESGRYTSFGSLKRGPRPLPPSRARSRPASGARRPACR